MEWWQTGGSIILMSKPHGIILFFKCHTCRSLIEILKKNTNFDFGTGLCTRFVHRGIAGNARQAHSWTVSDQRTVFSGSLLTHQNSMKNRNSHKCLQMTSRVYREMRQQGHGSAKRTSHFNKIIIISLDSAEKSQNKITGRENKSFHDKGSIYVIKMHQVTFHSGCVYVCVCM